MKGNAIINMAYDRMGRRVTKNDQRFVYNGYLQIANHHSSTPTPTQNSNYYIWDPTEPIATRPLAWTTPTTDHESPITNFYTHDGNKNVSEVIACNNDITAHYEYAPFGSLTVSRGTSAATNPWRFSSEYADDEPGDMKIKLAERYTGSQCKDAIRSPDQKCPCEKCYIYKANLPEYKLIGSYDGSLSWVKDSARDDSALLKHEQIHLRIEQKEAENEAEKIRKKWVKGGKYCSWAAAYDSASTAMESEVKIFYDQAFEAIEKIQKEYDEETNHGANSEKQDEYNKKYE